MGLLVRFCWSRLGYLGQPYSKLQLSEVAGATLLHMFLILLCPETRKQTSTQGLWGPRLRTTVFIIVTHMSYDWSQLCVCAQSLQLCLTLCGPVDYSPSDSSVHGILQVRILGWVAMVSSRGSSAPRDWTPVSYIFCIGRRVLYH